MRAVLEYAVRKVLRRPRVELADVAHRTWIVQPAERARRPRAVFLDGQLDRVVACQEETTREIEMGRVLGADAEHAATRAYAVRNVTLAGGRGVYAAGMQLLLANQSALSLASGWGSPERLQRASLDSSWAGNKYFGHWLTDDCPLHLLAREYAPPVGVGRPRYAHADDYCRMWGFEMRTVANAHVDELIVFDDVGQNAHKRRRLEALRAALAEGATRDGPCDVYLRRGTSGALRLLVNEAEVEERLVRRGFVVIDPTPNGADAIVQACLGARCVVGVEGSALAHAVVTLSSPGALVALEPAWRFNNVFKDYTDSLGMTYGFVIGPRDGEGFRIDPDELERTLDRCQAVVENGN